MAICKNIVVIGASWGGLNAFKTLLPLFPKTFSASVFIVQHQLPSTRNLLPDILGPYTHLPVIQPKDGTAFKPGVIYVAPSNHHLLVQKEHVAVTFGPRENRARPSIDALFRSAAAYQGPRVIGVLLTGYQNDGVGGLSAIQRCGGIAVVQDPAEAEVPELPQTAIERLAVDHILPLARIAETLAQRVTQPVNPTFEVPEDIMEEVRASEHVVPDLDHMQKIGDLTPYTCPECGGVLWQTKNEPLTRYVCHTGHSFSPQSFLEGQAEVIENSLWAAIRYIQERIDILLKMADAQRHKGRSADEYEKKASEMKTHVVNIRRFIVSGALNTAVDMEAQG
jgi:two-component system, chemotaxis family, protein-glutamate methylesterase/glutaminase